MRWWLSGAIGAVRKRHDEHAHATDAKQPFQASRLSSAPPASIFLVDILTLPDTPGATWKVYALSRRPLPPWSPPPSPAVTHLCLDLADSAAVSEALAPLTDVFYVAWAPHFIEEENREANSGMLCNVLSVVVTNCPALVHVSLQTGSKHLIVHGQVHHRDALLRGHAPAGLPQLRRQVRVGVGGAGYEREDSMVSLMV
uniref:3-beta hydroxysteroid dehydrogenase/isomerase domain-containing protein n=1 Tax=Oryza punctata TaxID=4537 RepID=A0A0E0KFI3_ORYPU